MFDSTLPPGERIAVLEEHARQEMRWRSDHAHEEGRWRAGMERWREAISREVTIIHVKVALFSAIGGAIGSAIVGIVLWLLFAHASGTTPPAHTP